MSNKKDIKISNELLSFVLDLKEGKVYNIESTCGDDRELEISYFDDDGALLGMNLDTFIRLAKIKAFECGYEIVELIGVVRIYDYRNDKYEVCKMIPANFENYTSFSVDYALKALEWVADKVGGDNV